MANGSLLSILHLSDFHFTKRRVRDQNIIVDALVDDLGRLCIGHRRPDVIIFTGDLVNAGGIDGHDEAYDCILDRILTATGCSDERLFIVPGNHDASRAVVDKSRDLHTGWREKANDLSFMNTLYDEQKFAAVARDKFSAYSDLEQYLSDHSLKHRNEFAAVYRIEALNIDIVTINTAMLSSGGHKDLGSDEGRLSVPEYAVRDAVKELSAESYRIFAAHHPFRMLSEASARYLKGAIERHGNIHLYGHMHDPDSSNINGFKGNIFSNQAGAVFTDRKEAYIGYSLISVERNTHFYEVHVRSYFDDREAFDEARDIIENGRFYSSQEAREFWRKIATPIDDHAFRMHLAGRSLNALRAEEDKGPSDRDPHEMFVPPPMQRTFIQSVAGDDIKSTIDEPVVFDDLVSGDSSTIIYAAPEYGRTTVLRELQFRLLLNANTLRFARLPIIIDFTDIKQNVSNLFRVIKGRALEVPDGVSVDALLELGRICLLFDDVVFGDTRRINILREFVTNYPKVRYILSSTKASAAPFGAHVVPEMPVHFDFVELCVLRRREMRLLVLKFGGPTDVDVVLDRLQSEFQEINLPFTAANGSILMSIYEEQSGFRPINRSVLIEQFIDTTLRKAAVEQSRRETFDYANKTALLAHISGWMAECNEYIPTAESVRTEMAAYLDNLGLIAPLDRLMSEFYAARIFVRRPDDRLSFRYRAVMEYFIAMQMREKPAFKKWVMDDNRYLQFVNEIQYYAGKIRNDAELVDEIGCRFASLLEEIEREIGVIDLNQLTTLKLPTKDSAGLTVDNLSQQLSAPPLTQEQRDEELEAELPRDIETRQEVFRPQIDNPAQKLLVGLFLYSGVLKNMELIQDAEKRRHLAELWKGWSIFLHSSLSVVPLLAQHRRVRINGVLYEISAPHGMSDEELARIISLKMPTGISKVLSATLGTEKLERQLVESELDMTKYPLVYELLRASLIADLRLNAAAGALCTALERLRPSNYLLEAMIWKIADLRRLDRLQQAAFEEIIAPIAESIAVLKGGTRMAKSEEKRRQIERLRHEGVLLRLRRHSERD